MKQETELEDKSLYHKKGQVAGAIGATIQLVVGVGVAVLVIIFVGALAGQTFNLVEPQIDAITNTTIRTSVLQSIISGFNALKQTADYLPIIVLAIVIFLVLVLVLGFTQLGQFGAGGGGQRGGSVL